MATAPSRKPDVSDDDKELLSAEFMSKLDRLEILSRKIFAGRMKGERRSKRKGESVEFADYRNYVVGDDLRFLDWNIYPPETEHDIFQRGRASQGHAWLTSPIKYIATVPLDPFREKGNEGELLTYESGGANAGALPCHLDGSCGACLCAKPAKCTYIIV